jgi:ATP-binding cassette, subfamily B, bacterial PglK
MFFGKVNKIVKSEYLRKYFFYLIFFSIVISIIELIGVSAIMPFIDIAANLSLAQDNYYYNQVFIFFSFEDEINFTISFGLLLFVFYIFRGWANYAYHYRISILTQKIYAETTRSLYNAYLGMPYKAFISKNSSFLNKVIITEAVLFSSIVNSFLLIISELFVVLFLYLLMLVVSVKVTLIFTLFIAIKSFFLAKTVSNKIKIAGKNRAHYQENFYEILNRTLGNYKHIKLQSKAIVDQLEKDFDESVSKYVHANIINAKLSVLPRLILETAGFSLIALVLVFLLYEGQSNIAHILPTLSLFVVALYRLLPSVNRIFNGFNTIMYNYQAVEIINNELQIEQDILGDDQVLFDKSIELKGVYFNFNDVKVLHDINMVIKKNSKIAIIGESGSGKSTLADLIIGLYRPINGCVTIDGVPIGDNNMQSWRSKIGYIPQQVYLFDGTVSENVVFGRKFNYDHLVEVLKKANIYNYLVNKNGINTMVGEGGSQLSGGQMQRIAIARALYGSPEIIVLDEATSALDENIEEKIMNEIYQISKDKTLIIIAHRLNTIKGCDIIYKIKDGGVYVT